MKERSNKSFSKSLMFFAVAVISLFILFSIFTYFDGLSQYGTADQNLTLSRIQTFLSDPKSPVLTSGSNFSNIVVGYPGNQIEKFLDSRYQPDAHIVGNIYYTAILPFALVQAVLAIILLFLVVFLLGKLSNWQLPEDYLNYLVALAIVLNFPMLKGLCKVLKYDCLSILIAAISLLVYFLDKKKNIFYYFVASIALCAIAFIEKDTVISVLFFIIIAELIIAFLSASSFRDYIKKVFGSLATILVIFPLVVSLFVPKIWSNPSELGKIFSSLPSYGVSFDNYKLITSMFVLSILIFFARDFLVRIYSKFSRYFSFKFFLILLSSLFFFALFYQANDLKWTNSSAVQNKVQERGIFVGKKMAEIAITTLDKNATLTRIKLLSSEIRLVFYFLPELLIIILLLSPLILKQYSKFILDRRTVALFIGFIILNITAYAYLITPIEAKYLTLVMFLLLLFGSSLLVVAIRKIAEKYSGALPLFAIFVVLIMLTPSYRSAPSHFGYMNIFRNRSYEEVESINPEDYTFWTWMGWGETSYSLIDKLSKNLGGKSVVVGYDYLPPFHVPSNVTLVKSNEICDFTSMGQMNLYLSQLSLDGKVDYLIISKNTANRSTVLNQLLKEKADKAVLTDTTGGITYGWLFRPADLQESGIALDNSL
ncbi:MAG: hypothetical protein NTW50_02945 [Candidatus Berkelbacteria bacterium]|nr:hypothetical protein [Candidatus Berkelbacteria bacterium]